MAKVDKNWQETRVTAKDLEELLGIPAEVSEELFKTVENLALHKLVEEFIKNKSTVGKDFAVSLPYFGTLVISFGYHDKLTWNFVPCGTFLKTLRAVHWSKESPLTEQLCEVLSKDLMKTLEGGELIDERFSNSK